MNSNCAQIVTSYASLSLFVDNLPNTSYVDGRVNNEPNQHVTTMTRNVLLIDSVGETIERAAIDVAALPARIQFGGTIYKFVLDHDKGFGIQQHVYQSGSIEPDHDHARRRGLVNVTLDLAVTA